MTKKPDGGPAYPLLELDQRTGGVYAQRFGMSLRDAFAIAALGGLTAKYDFKSEDFARVAYKIADAMLAESAS